MVTKAITALLAFVILAASGPGAAAPGVLQHHNDAGRSGHYTVPGLTIERAAKLHRDPHFDGRVRGAINAQPLYWNLPDGRGLIIVATEDNVVAALDAHSGKPVWEHRLGPPVPRSKLPCGNITPLGITGTPIIDRARQAVYLDAMMLVNGQPRHRVFGLSLTDGSVLPGWPIDIQKVLHGVEPPFTARTQNQRGALALLDGRLYIPFGGHFGDCGNYHGWVIGLSVNQPHRIVSFSTRARGGGIWAPGGIAAADGSLFVSTGNTFDAQSWKDGEAILRLPPNLNFTRHPRDFFAPRDWRELDAFDQDLSGVNPLPLQIPGARPSNLVLALGKNGEAYLLDRSDLGGVGGALSVSRVARGAIRMSPTTYTAHGTVYVVFQGYPRDCPSGERGDLVALRIGAGTPPSMHIAWCANAHGRGSPIVTTTKNGGDPLVWIAGAEGDNRLRAFNGVSGQVVFDGHGTRMKPVAHFQTPIAASGRIYVAANGRVYAFVF